MERNKKEERQTSLLISLLGTISDATDRMEVEETGSGQIYTLHFRYEPSFGFSEEDIQTLKELSEDTCEDYASTLLKLVEDAGKRTYNEL